MSALAKTEAGFDYSALSDNAARVAQDAASRIHHRHQQQMSAIIETGRDLIEVKASLEHGHFAAWLAAEFGMTDRSARRYMQAAAGFEAKSDTVSVLPARAIYALSASSTPPEFRDEIVAEIEAGSVPTSGEIEDRLKEAKQAQVLSTGSKAKKAKLRKKSKAEQSEEREEAHRREREAQMAAAANNAVAYLIERLGDDIETFLDLMEGVDPFRFGRLIAGLRSA